MTVLWDKSFMLKDIKSRKIFKAVIIIIIFVFLIIINPYNLFNKVRGVFFGATYPIQKVFSVSANKIYSFGDAISSIGKFKEENEYLIKENLRLKSENIKLGDIEKENSELREQLGLLPREDYDLLASSIIGKDLYKGNNWMMIDKGSKDGLEKGMPVIVSEGVLVGKIEEVFYTNSRVVPITSPSSSINAVTSETGAIGVVNGKYGLGVVLDMVLQTDYLKLGDEVITSEISQNMPRGLLIGKIEEISTSEGDLFQKATLSSPVDFYKIRHVFVIKSQK